MEENLMEKLLNDFNGTLEEFNKLVENNDIDAVERVFAEVTRLMQEEHGIVLDNREDPQYDHVLHELLDKMHGTMEQVITVEGIGGEPGTRFYTNEQVQEMIDEAEREASRLADVMRETEFDNPEAYNNARSERTAILQRIANLRASLVEGKEFSTLTYIDENLKALQEERARLVEEKNANLAEIDRLREEETPGVAADPADQARLDEVNARITELENLIPSLEEQIATARETSISSMIASLREQTGNRADLEARLENLQTQLRQAGERIEATRGFDEQNAQAHADYNNIVQQISDVNNQMAQLVPNEENIEFLESLLPDVQRTDAVLEPADYTDMGRLSEEQIIRRLLSEQLNLSEEEINETIGQYSLVQVDTGAHDEQGEDNPISMRQLVRTTTTKGDLTVGEALEALEAQLQEGPLVDHTQEIADIDTRIAELDGVISEAEAQIEQIQGRQISDVIAQNRENDRQRAELEARLGDLQAQLREAGDRVRETRGEDSEYAIARSEYSRLVQEIAGVNGQIAQIGSSTENIEFLESLLPDVQTTEAVLEPNDYTYMGRQSEEQIIRRLLSEQLNLSEEEINETIGQYSLVQAEDGAHDEYGEDNPISMRQLVRTTTTKGELTVGEASQAIQDQIAELEARRTELEAQLRETGNRVRETRGEDSEYAVAREEYSRLAQEIANVNEQIAPLQERQTRLNETTGIKAEQDKIQSAKDEQAVLRTQREELSNDTTRQENPAVRDKINKLKEISGIAALEAQLMQAREELENLRQEREGLTQGTPGREGVDNSARIAELEARNKEIDARIAEIDKEIANTRGAVPIEPSKTETRTYDVDAKAEEVGRLLFDKTAKIRRELADRHVSRDEFLAFYREGYNQSMEQAKELTETLRGINEEIKTVIVDPNSEKNYSKQIREAEKAGDSELTLKLYEQVRKNFIAAGREEDLKNMGLDHELSSPEDVENMRKFFTEYKKYTIAQRDQIKIARDEIKENAQIFTKEIKRIETEKATIALAGNSVEELEAKANERKEMRRKMLEASITPQNELTDEQIALLDDWQQASERFFEHKTTQEYTYIDREGKEQTVTVDTIDTENYPEYAKDVDFLGVPAYKENMEQISAYEQTGDPYAFGEKVGKMYDAAETQREGAGAVVLERIMRDKQRYVESFNGVPNPHRVKYENWKTAGSTLKGMKPVDRDLPAPTRARNAVENVARFFGIRPPKFTRIDEHGNKVRDIKGGAMTLAMDAAVAAAVGISAATVGPVLAISGYAAKGIVTAGNRIAARREYSKYKEQIDSNRPVLNQADQDSREVARKEYYREHGNNRFTSWAKAKLDRRFTRGRAREVERAIVDERMAEFEAQEDKRTDELKENLAIAEANQRNREDRQRQLAMGENAYNDIVRDPDAVDMDQATAALARNGALEAEKPGAGREDINPDAKTPRSEEHQYVKEEKPVARTKDLNEEALKATTGPVSAITEEQIYTGRKQHVDRVNKVLTMITAGAIKGVHTLIKNGFTKTEVIHHEPETETTTVHHDAETATRIEHHDAEYQDVVQEQYDTSVKLVDVTQNSAGKTVTGHYKVSGGASEPLQDTLGNSEKITAGWFDDGTKWGTGVSDSQGLTAPVLTDRLVDSGLMDANGVLNQDATIQDLLDAMGYTGDLTDLSGVYVSIGDKEWVALSDLMDGMKTNVVVGQELVKDAWDETITETLREAWDETIETVVKEGYDETIRTFAPGLVGEALGKGALAGAAVGLADELHEAAQTTYINGATPGRPEEATPEALDSFDQIADKLQATANEERAYNQEEENRETEKADRKAQRKAEREAKKKEKRQRKQEKQEQDEQEQGER